MTQLLTPTINAHCQRHIGCVNNATGVRCPVANSCEIARLVMGQLDDTDTVNVIAELEREIEDLRND